MTISVCVFDEASQKYELLLLILFAWSFVVPLTPCNGNLTIDTDTRDQASTVSFLNSCAKEEISPTTTVQEESPSMATSLKMKTLP